MLRDVIAHIHLLTRHVYMWCVHYAPLSSHLRGFRRNRSNRIELNTLRVTVSMTAASIRLIRTCPVCVTYIVMRASSVARDTPRRTCCVTRLLSARDSRTVTHRHPRHVNPSRPRAFNPHPADHDYCRFQFVLLVYQITVFGNKMCV